MADNQKIVKYVGIGCGVVLLLGCCIGGGAYFACAKFAGALGAPKGQATGFFYDMREGRPEAALQRMSGAYQASHDLARFQQATMTIPAIATQTDTTFNNIQINGGGATVSGTLTTPNGPQPVTVTLSNLGENWYIDSITIGGVPLQ
jgi:hypothetical protein